jgi:DNA repair protein RadC
MNYLSIKQWAAEDQPREKLLTQGSRVLSDAELLAILIGSGTRDLSAVELARKVLSQSANNLSELGKLSVKELTKVKGIGEAKAITIMAALELGRRRNGATPELKKKITSSQDAAGLFLAHLSDIPHEEFWIAYFNRSNILIEKTRISQGGISGTVTDVRLIMKKSVELLASCIILCHNHPSGNLNYSDQDLEITRKITEAAALFDIKLLDHIIVAGNKYFSFADEGLLK